MRVRRFHFLRTARYHWLKLGSLFCFLIISSLPVTFAEPLVFTAAPRETPEMGARLYTPVAEFISKTIKRPVKYEHAEYWLRYQAEIKKLSYDFVFDGPHLASWRISNINHKPLVRMPGHLEYYLIVRSLDRRIKRPEDVITRKVCAIPAPNLTAVMLLKSIKDPVREPGIIDVKGGMKEIVNMLIQRECDAAMVRADYYHHRMSDKERSKVRVIYSSPKLPNQVITVSDKINLVERRAIVDAFMSSEGKKVLAPILERYAGKGASPFIVAGEHEYDGYSRLLEDYMIGW